MKTSRQKFNKPPSCPPLPHEKAVASKRIKQIREYRLITPLWGGGVEPNTNDPVQKIRGTEIRGHLRYWWRATRGVSSPEETLASMHERETKIWGSASTPSSVVVFVRMSPGGKEEEFSEKNNRNQEAPSSLYSYVTFPLRNTSAPISMKFKFGFTLEISYPSEFEKDVQAALWAWELFGGVGARTRRGFGALQCVKIDGNAPVVPSLENRGFENHIKAGLERYCIGCEHKLSGLPHLSPCSAFVIYGKTVARKDPLQVWLEMINKYRGFRQQRDKPLDPNKKHPGRSHWPEPDFIRRWLSQEMKKEWKHKPKKRVDKVPRAVFGLPIIFWFKEREGLEPPETRLEGTNGIDRMASPLIFKPVPVKEGFAGLALVLEEIPFPGAEPYAPPGGFTLKSKDDNYCLKDVKSQLTPEEAQKIEPLNANSHTQTNPLAAFLSLLSKETL